jgi:SNF2 family DNA or RNA helicase
LIQKVLDENERMKPPNEALKFTDLEKYKNQKSLYYTASSRLVSSQFSNYEYPRLKESDFKDAVRNPLTKREKEIEKEKLEQIQNEADLPLETEEGSEMTIDEINQEILGKQDKDTAVGMKIMDLPKADGGWITEEEIENLQDAGEKIDEILLDITGDEGEGKHAIYTRFKTYYGSRLLGSLLDLKGISYVFFDGDMDDNDRIKVLERFNSPENINGDKIKVIILTSAGSAGINLKEIRRFHILEQYFNLSYMKQVIGRGVRYLSHERLPLHKRNITIRNYFLNLATPDQTKILSPDYLLYDLAKSKDRKIAKIRELIQTFGV